MYSLKKSPPVSEFRQNLWGKAFIFGLKTDESINYYLFNHISLVNVGGDKSLKTDESLCFREEVHLRPQV